MSGSAPQPISIPADVTVGVLTGGLSRERDRSLLSGRTVAGALTAVGYQVRVVDTAEPDLPAQLHGVDLAFLAIAGRHAEDGKLQGFLETVGLPYTGSGVLASALAMHKPAAKTIVAAAGIPVLPHTLVDSAEEPAIEAKEIVDRLGCPAIVKPVSEGGSIDVAVAHTAGQLADLLAQLRSDDQQLLAEPFVVGAAVTVGVLEVDGALVALPALETTGAAGFYDFAAKRDAALRSYRCPAQQDDAITAALADGARRAHQALGCSGYSRSDFIVASDGAVWWLEANTLPGLSRTGNLATMAAVGGTSYERLVIHILATAARSSRYLP
jgi:D-alanine-D-alanine ligase